MIYRKQTQSREGAIIPLLALSMLVIMGLLALAIDVGVLVVARNQTQNAVDSASLAGARTINGDKLSNYNFTKVPANAVLAATNNYILGDKVNGNPNEDWDSTDSAVLEKIHPNGHTFQSGDVTVEIGSYTYYYNDANPSEEGFKLQFPRKNDQEPYSAVKASINYQGSFYFGQALGMSSFDTSAGATAIHRPRDVVIIMDLSGSMRFQSLPGRPYWGSRTASLNPEAVYPVFGHYSDESAAALRGTKAVATGSGEYYDPANLTVETDAGPPVVEYFFQNKAGETPDPAVNAAFQRASNDYADGVNGPDGGDVYLKKSGNTGTSFAQTVEDIVGTDSDLIKNFQEKGYDYFYHKIDPSWDFKGHIEGPGYWGKTFFIWPPDPRGADDTKVASNAAHHADNGAKDWRQRFFIMDRYNYGSSYDKWLHHNNVLWQSNGRPRNPQYSSHRVTNDDGTWTYRINYAAILKWLDTDPKPFPPRLRAGKIVYYDAFPDYTDTTLNSRWWSTDPDDLSDKNERFWKGYIDFVLGFVWEGSRLDEDSGGNYYQDMIGNGRPYEWGNRQIREKPTPGGYIWESDGKASVGDNRIWLNFGGGGSPQKGDKITFEDDPTQTEYEIDYIYGYYNDDWVEVRLDIGLLTALYNNDDYEMVVPKYMDYEDNPNRPKHQWWFGPMTMIDYLGNYNLRQFWWPGNVPEAQNWSCKMGIQTAIDDIRNNHPNDFVAMTYFSSPKHSRSDDGQHNMAVIPLGRDYINLKRSLWFPPSTITGGVTEIDPWHSDFGNVPRAKGGTSPAMGLMIAYNQFSSSTKNLRFYTQPSSLYRGAAGGLGRKGAQRIVILETDGAPNTHAEASLQGSGKDSYYPIRVKNPTNLSSTQNVEWPDDPSWDNFNNEVPQVYAVVEQIVASENASKPGYTTERNKAKVYCIAYGTLFDPANSSDPQQADALEFLQTIQKIGNTSENTNPYDFPENQRVYGNTTQRINRLQKAFTSILQGGIQVSLFE